MFKQLESSACYSLNECFKQALKLEFEQSETFTMSHLVHPKVLGTFWGEGAIAQEPKLDFSCLQLKCWLGFCVPKKVPGKVPAAETSALQRMCCISPPGTPKCTKDKQDSHDYDEV